MPENVARAVGAKGRAFAIAGKEYQLRPLGIRELMEVERDCIERYKRRYLETYKSNLDVLPENVRADLLMKKLDEVARWDIDDLPAKDAYDPSRIKLTDSLKKWLVEYWGIEGVDDMVLARMTAAALDQEALLPDKYKELTGCAAPCVKVSYVDWWTTGAYEGMVTTLWVCFSKQGVIREQIMDEFGTSLAKLNEMARELDKLSAPQMGNG
jgi:hypothetical protein